MLTAEQLQNYITLLDTYIEYVVNGCFDMDEEQATKAALSAKQLADAFRFVVNPVTDMKLINETMKEAKRHLRAGIDPETISEIMDVPVELFEAMMLEQIRQNVESLDTYKQN